jgi:hypothetical protein
VLIKWGSFPFFHVISNDLGMLLRLIGSESRKWILSTNTLRILLPFIINCGSHLSSRNLLSRNCALYPRDLCEIRNLIRERRNSRIYSINLPTGSCQNAWIRFPHCSQSTLLSSTVSHLKHFLSTYVVGTCSKDPSRFSSSCVHSVSKETYKIFPTTC